jgi:hypothetical protein
MDLHFLVDRDAGLPHIAQHGVTETEVREVLRSPGNEGPGRDDTRIAEGQTASGRYLRVIYKQNELDDSLLVITAYDLSEKAKQAYRRRRRRRQ